MNKSVDPSPEERDRDRALRRRRFLMAGGGVVLGGLLTGCNFNREQGADTGESTTTGTGTGSTSSTNPLSGSSGNSSS